jgi:stage IV sporulation protein FA
MLIRDNVRRRRQERIEKLLGQLPDIREHHELSRFDLSLDTSDESSPRDHKGSEVLQIPGPLTEQVPESEPEPDPEKWWKEHERRRRAEAPNWTGMGKLAPVRTSPPRQSVSQRNDGSSFGRSFALRLAAAAVVFGMAWGWFVSGLPGGREARTWTIQAVTKDMDFHSVEVWYEQKFGGSPAFLPIFRSSGDTRAVSGVWDRQLAVLPVEGRIVQTFAQDGSGVRIAASGGSGVKAVYAGRILQVATEADGKSTVLVQHAGQIVTVYGNLESPTIKAGDWVEAGQRLGSIPAPLDTGGESLLRFAVKKNGKTLDPAEVVPFD